MKQFLLIYFKIGPNLSIKQIERGQYDQENYKFVKN